MTKKYLYLDDVRTPIDNNWIVVRNYEEFVNVITEKGLDNFEVISLDHDLGESAMNEFFDNVYINGKLDYNNITEKTGFDCAKFLIELSMDSGVILPQIYVHSANPVGTANIIEIVNNFLHFNGLKETCTRVNIPHTTEYYY